MQSHKYTLEPYSGMKTRYQCPSCEKKKVFTKYIDTHTKEYLNDAVGKCDRVIKCGYHYKPKQYFNNNNIPFDPPAIGKTHTIVEPKTKASFINIEVMNKTMATKHPNYFIDYLTQLCGHQITNYLAGKYNIGTSNHWNGASIFWQMDIEGRLRTGKIMLYNPSNGKRIKEPYNHINWMHKSLKLDNFSLEQCYFGEHLLNEDSSKPVAIVESEKTAIISSVYLPEFIWMACGGINNINKAKTEVLKGRDVVLFPDLKCYDLWNDKIPSLTKMATFRISTLLRDKATEAEKEQGLDIADYLVRLNPKIN
ncbi:DUF6371 domain-containing protein [Arenibacter palladensis]|uniref:DUF6371 domain-containing protein n=1 Tax=Arenibacter palladensis TaxID=237373 RepID=UPI002FD27F44